MDVSTLFTFLLTLLFADESQIPYKKEFLVLFSVSLAVETAFIIYLHNINERFEQEVKTKNRQLQALTNSLQEEIKKEVLSSRKKDATIIQQSKMASVGDMISNIAHQWKQPIATIDMILAKAQISFDLDIYSQEKTKRALHDISLQTTLMHETMQDFLLFSRPDLQDTLFSVNKAICIMRTLIEPSFNSRNITIKYIEESTNVIIKGKQNEFIHAIMNIANNANDAFVQNNTQNATLKIELRQEENTVTLVMSDNAGGIPKEIIDHIFDSYFTTKLNSGGTGLGLDLSKQVITEHMNGTITAKNSGEGATFIITFNIDQITS